MRLSAATRSGRLLALLLWLCLGCAQAATYSYRSDSFSWETAANTVSWDKSCTGYPGDDDKATLTFTGGFTFPFAGTAYTSVRVLSNGMLQFGADTGFFRTYTNTNLPAGAASAQSGCAAGATTNVLMAYWTDLNPVQAGGGNVSWEQKGTAPNRYVVVSWNAVYQYNTSTPYAVQVILFENGEFKYQYGNANASGSNATIGVQVSNSDYTLYSYNSGYNANGSAIRWFQPSGAPARMAEYRFDEYSWNGSVGEVKDSSGNNNHGVRVGAAANVSGGYICCGLDIPANSNSTIAAVDTALDVDTAVGSIGTLSFWTRSNVAWNSAAAMLMDATLSSTRSFHLSRLATGALRFVVSDSAGTTLTANTAAQTFAAGTWVHVAATWSLRSGASQSTLRLYVNGVQSAVTTGSTSGQLDPSLGSLFLGDNRSSFTPSGGTTSSANGRLDEVRIYNFELSPAEIALDIAQTHSCAPPLHHLEIHHPSGSGLTCTPSTLTVIACQDAACASVYTGGVSGTLSASGSAGTVNWPDGAAINIPASSSSVDLRVQLTSPGSVTLGASSSAPVATNSTSCNFGSPNCLYTAEDSALLLNASNHVAESSGVNLTVSAVKRADNSLACVPAFTGSKSINLSCGYLNPSSGSLPVRVGGKALNSANNSAAACDSSGQTLTLDFGTTGVASAALAYADVGQVQINARYSGSGSNNSDVGLVMSGSTSVIAAPASFGFSAVTSGTIRAGSAFAASLSARNALGRTTPNFGRETPAQTPTLSHTKAQPSGAGASNGVLSGGLGAFSNGSASSSTLVWSEVGRIDLNASLANYLGSGFSVAGSTGSSGALVGRFIPHHFDVVTTPACGSFSYASQPFSVTITAMNGLVTPTRTLNYDGSGATSPNFAQAVTLSDAGNLGLGSLSGGALAASRFSAGIASSTSVAYAFTDKLTAQQTLALRAVDADGASSSGWAEGSMLLRSGRLWLSNAFGSEKVPLQMTLQAQYWSSKAWVLNSADSCTALPAAAVVRSGYLNNQGTATSAWSTSAGSTTLSAGNGWLMLTAPGAGLTGSVDIALNLGSSSADQSCLASHPASSSANLPWLRARYGGCASSWDRDPAARASFGVASPETRKTVHVRELF
jgi:MSHA biogenesis protein MshQ